MTRRFYLGTDGSVGSPALAQRALDAAMSAYVKSPDPHHLVSSCEDALHMADFVVPTIDFVTGHAYPLYLGITPEQYGSADYRPVSSSRSVPQTCGARGIWLCALEHKPLADVAEHDGRGSELRRVAARLASG